MRMLLPIIVLCCASCARELSPVEIRFAAALDGTPISCGAVDSRWRLTDLRFYVSNVRLRDAGGEWVPVTLAADDMWQNDQVTLIDLEDGEGACINGSAETNAAVRGFANPVSGTGLSFDIGVPGSLNHADPLIAGAPLSYTVMHWHWASGYKFLRAGVETADDSFFLHLGSSRCTGTIGDIQGCQASNRASVVIADFDPSTDTVIVDIGRLFAGVNLACALAKKSSTTRTTITPPSSSAAAVFSVEAPRDASTCDYFASVFELVGLQPKARL